MRKKVNSNALSLRSYGFIGVSEQEWEEKLQQANCAFKICQKRTKWDRCSDETLSIDSSESERDVKVVTTLATVYVEGGNKRQKVLPRVGEG